MTLPVRKGYSGNGVTTTLTSNPTISDTTFTVASTTNWPTTYPFFVVVDPGTTKEEKMLVTGVASLTVTVTRGSGSGDGTSAIAHSSGAICYPVFTATEAREANLIASVMTTKGDLISTNGLDINRLPVGTNTHVLQADSTATNGVKWGQVVNAGLADSAVTSAKILDGTIVNADVNASAAIALTKLGTGALPTTITVASANIVDGTIVNADINTSAAIAHSKLANATAGQVLLGTTTSGVITATTVSGDVTVNGAGVTAIGSGVIVNADINTSAAIALSKLATGALPTAITVASANIVNGTIVADDLDSNAVTTAKIANANVTNAKLNNGASGDIPLVTVSSSAATGGKNGDIWVVV